VPDHGIDGLTSPLPAHSQLEMDRERAKREADLQAEKLRAEQRVSELEKARIMAETAKLTASDDIKLQYEQKIKEVHVCACIFASLMYPRAGSLGCLISPLSPSPWYT